MNMNTKKQIYLPFIAAILIMVIGVLSFGVSNYRVKNDLNNTKNSLTSTKNDLITTQKNLQDEIKKSAELNDALENANKDLKYANKKIESINKELEIANKTIDDLSGEEYKLVYLGDYTITHYCCEKYAHVCGTGNGITATGTNVTAGRTVAVDPSVIPYGTTMYIEGYGFRVAEDCGGGVNGRHIDVAVDTHANAIAMGTGSSGVWILVKN